MNYLRYRLEVYCGTKQDRKYVDTQAGPVAVVRNLQAVWKVADPHKRRTIVCDREYTSPALALRLRRMGYDLLGTCSKSRLGFPKSLQMKTKNRPAKMARGTSAIARNIEVLWLWSYPCYDGLCFNTFFLSLLCSLTIFLRFVGRTINWFTS